MDAQGMAQTEPQTEPQPQPEPELPQYVREACDLAASGAEPPDTPLQIVAARKDYSARGRCREHWYRLAWRGGEWRYLGDRRLAVGRFLAADRHDAVDADVWPGELIVEHDRGGPIRAAYLVTEEELMRCELRRTRDGQLRITLPDGRDVVRPNPRR
jgi:hypothetical protein